MIYLTFDQDETRATRHPLVAAIERFIGWMLWGPRQHVSDLRFSPVQLQRINQGETIREGVQR